MGLAHSPGVVTNGLVFYYDMLNTARSWKGAPTTNLIVSTPLSFGVYAYASGPVSITTSDRYNTDRSVKRYTITSAVNTARASIYPYITVGQTYSFSCMIRYNGGVTSNPSFEIDASKGYPEGNNNTLSNVSGSTTYLGNNWYLVKRTFTVTASPTGRCILTYGVATGSDTKYLNETFDVYDEQFELGSFATPFVNGTRTNTQSLIDLTNNTTITANSLTYNADGTFGFNGSSNVITSATPNLIVGNNPFSKSAWIYSNYKGTSTNHPNIISWGGDSTNNKNGLALMTDASNNPQVLQWFFANDYTWNITDLTGAWHNVVVTYSSPTLELFIDGVSQGTRTVTGTPNVTNTNLEIGYFSSSTYAFNGIIPVIHVYNKALSAAEVKQNFNALRGRYGV